MRKRILAEGDLFGEALLKAWDFELIDLYLEWAERILNPVMPNLQNSDSEHERLMQLPEVRQQLDEMLARHYRDWLDNKIPAPGNRTPRKAVRDPDGREAVAALIAQIERTTPSRSDLHELGLRWGVIEVDTHVKAVLAAAAQFVATAGANGVPGDNVDELEPDIRRRMKRLLH